MGQCFRRALAGRATDGRYGYIRPLSTLQLVAQYCVLYQVPGTGTCICLVSRVRSACARYCTMLCSAAAHDSNVRCVPKLCANDSWLYSIRANSSVLKTLQFIIMLSVLTTDSCGAVGFQLQPTLNLVDIISCKTLSSTPGCSDSFLRTMCCSTSVPPELPYRKEGPFQNAGPIVQDAACMVALQACRPIRRSRREMAAHRVHP